MTDRTKKQTLPTVEKFDPPPPSDDVISQDHRNGRPKRARASLGRPRTPSQSQNAAERPPKKERRRRIDPTTFERQYSDDEVEFMNAIQRFKVQSGRSYPTYGEVLEVAQKLGYRKVDAASSPPRSVGESCTPDPE